MGVAAGLPVRPEKELLMVATNIEVAYLAPIIAVSFTAVISLMAWIVQTIERITNQVSGMEERSEDHERRIRDLENAAR